MYKISFGILYLLIGILLAIILFPLIARSDAPPSGSSTIHETIVLPPFHSVSRAYIESLVMMYCPIEHRAVALVIIKAESNFNQYAIGDHGLSHGLVQIYQPAHPTITVEQAFNVNFSVKFLCDNLIKGNQGMWSTNPLKGS